MENNKNIEMGKQAVTTRLQSRTAMFLPVGQLSKNFTEKDIEVKNKYGTITLQKCKLTQVHRNIVDIIFSNFEPIRLDDGAVAFTFSLYEILAKLGNGHRGNNKWLVSKLEDMRQASIVLKTEDDEKSIKCYQGVIREHQETRIKSNLGTKLYGVIFSNNFMKMFDNDLNIHSAKLTPTILSFEHHVTQAFARACISHRQLNAGLDEILESIGVNKGTVTSSAYRQNRGLILKESEALEEKLGIKIRRMKMDKRKWGVFYSQHDDVWFSDPTRNTKIIC